MASRRLAAGCRRLLACALLLLALGGCSPRAAEDSPAQDWRVYQAVIAVLDMQPGGAPLLLREATTQQDNLPLDLAAHSKAVLRALQVDFEAEMQPATLRSFRDRNAADTVSSADFPPNASLTFLDADDLAAIAGESDSYRAALRQRYPGAVGLAAFSFVGFNDDHTQALVYASHPQFGQVVGEYLLFNLRGGAWLLAKRAPAR